MTEPDRDWVETLTGWAASLGMNPVRARWKLQRLANYVERVQRRGEGFDHVGYQHRVCGACGAVQDKEARVCSRCGAPLGSRATEKLRRLGLTVPRFSVSMVLGLLLTLCYARLMRASPEAGLGVLFTMDPEVLWNHGRWQPHAFWAGDWWRPVTSLFLHIGMWHATFNLLALAVVGPDIEEMYGRGPTLFAFLLTGAIANLVSGFMSPAGNAGASGALMGLIGLAAARGHLARTARGREVRELMLTWFVYTTLFGLLIGADHWAHGGGFIAGGLLGLGVSPRWFRGAGGKLLANVLGGAALVGTSYAVFLVMWPGAH